MSNNLTGKLNKRCLHNLTCLAGQEFLGVLPPIPQLLAAGLNSASVTGGTEHSRGVASLGASQMIASPMSQSQGGSNVTMSSPSSLPVVVPTFPGPLLSLQSSMPPASNNKHVLVAPGLPSISQRMIDKIKRGEYIDFNELPPARGLSKALPSHLEGQVVIVQADDLASSRKMIPNFETWAQCFSIYAAIRIASDPSRAGDLMAYNHSIASMAKKYPWPSWIMYDQAFREEAAYIPSRLWGKEDASLYAKCFNWGPSKEPNWCGNCQSLEHQAERCPHKPPSAKRVKEAKPEDPCKKFNNNDGNCSYGAKCKFPHKCYSCGGPHPYPRCPKQVRDQGKQRGGRA